MSWKRTGLAVSLYWYIWVYIWRLQERLLFQNSYIAIGFPGDWISSIVTASHHESWAQIVLSPCLGCWWCSAGCPGFSKLCCGTMAVWSQDDIRACGVLPSQYLDLDPCQHTLSEPGYKTGKQGSVSLLVRSQGEKTLSCHYYVEKGEMRGVS